MIAQWPIGLLNELPVRAYRDIESAIKHSYGERNLENIMEELVKGEKQVWMLSTDDEFKATIITHIVEHPQKKTCELIYLGGEDMLDMIPEFTAIEDWAVENGCKDFQAVGRPGWERVLKSHGYERRYITVGRNL